MEEIPQPPHFTETIMAKYDQKVTLHFFNLKYKDYWDKSIVKNIEKSEIIKYDFYDEIRWYIGPKIEKERTSDNEYRVKRSFININDHQTKGNINRKR